MRGAEFEFEIITTEDGLRALRPEWDALWERTAGHWYQSFDVSWLAWLHVARPEGRQLRCVVGRRHDELVLVWPLVTYRRLLLTVLRPLSAGTADYTNVLVQDGLDDAALIAGAWTKVVDVCLPDLSFLPYLPAGSALHALALRQDGVLKAAADVLAVAKLREETDWSAYCRSLGTLSGRKPGALERRLAKQGEVKLRVLAGPKDADELALIVDWMLACKRAWAERADKRGDWLYSRHYRDFLLNLLATSDREPATRLFVLELNGEWVAASVVGLGKASAMGLINGFAPKFARFGPGNLAVELCVKWAFEQRLDLDFGIGTEEYKAYWGRGQHTSMWSFELANTRRGRLASRARDTAGMLAKGVSRLRRPSEPVVNVSGPP